MASPRRARIRKPVGLLVAQRYFKEITIIGSIFAQSKRVMPDLTLGDSEILVRDKLVLRDSITGARVILMSCSAYRSMCDTLFDQFQSGASVILYRMGEGYGKKLIVAASKLGLTRDEMIAGFEHLAFLSGWGKPRVRIVDENNVECVVERSPFVLRREDVGPASCYFFSGILSSVASEILKKNFTAHEVMCESGGSPVCKFLISIDEKKAG